MKKLLGLFLILTLCLPMLGCGARPQPTQPSVPTQPPQTTAPTETTAPAPSQTTAPTQTTASTKPEAAYAIGDIYITADHALSGEYSEASVRVELEGLDIPEQTVKIKHRGNLSQTGSEKKSYNIKFEEKVSFLGMEEGKKWSLLADPFDKSLLRPVLAFEYAQALGIQFTSQVRLCRVWLNGEYRGVYTAVEPVDAGKNRVEINIDAGDFLYERNFNPERTEADITYFKTAHGLRFELNEPETPTEAELDAILAVLNPIESAIRSLDHTRYEQVVDVESFVNFYIFHEVVKDVDFGHYSTRYYVKDGVLYAGPPWDFDLSMGNVSDTYGEITYFQYHNSGEYGDGSGDSTRGLWAKTKDFYRWLCQDEYFMEQVRLRWQEVKAITENLVTENQLGISRIDFYLENAGEVLQSNYSEAGWPVDSPVVGQEYNHPADTYLGNAELLRQWLTDRIAWLDGEFGG